MVYLNGTESNNHCEMTIRNIYLPVVELQLSIIISMILMRINTLSNIPGIHDQEVMLGEDIQKCLRFCNLRPF